MSEGLFRKKSLEKISSPEQVNEYIKTSNLNMWMIFAAVSLILIGAVVWGVFGRIDISLGGVVVCDSGVGSCYISESDLEKITDEAYIRINGENHKIENVSELPVPANGTLSPYAMHLAELEDGEWVYSVAFEGNVADGIHKAEVVTESVSPFSLLMN